jgi:hypothetical protein
MPLNTNYKLFDSPFEVKPGENLSHINIFIYDIYLAYYIQTIKMLLITLT